MKNSLLWRYIVIVCVFAVALLCVRVYPLNLGIDLAGGTSLLYELDTQKLQASNESPAELAARVIEILKVRVDPYGQKNLIWRVIGGKRIQVQMPLPSKQTQLAKKALEDAETALTKTTLRQSEVQAAIELTGDARAKAISDLAPPADPRHDLIVNLATAQDALKAAQAEEDKYPAGNIPVEVLAKKTDASAAFNKAKAALDATNVDMTSLRDAVESANLRGKKANDSILKALLESHPSQRAQIQAYADAYHDLMSLSGGGVEDAADLQRMITSSGVLDFRITVGPSELGATGGSLELNPAYQEAVQSLRDKGPTAQLKINGLTVRWFIVDDQGVDNFSGPGTNFILSKWQGHLCVLCYDDAIHTLTHNSNKKSWSVHAGTPYRDPTRGEILPFSLDSIGASLMGDLTGDNMGHPMCILLDDRAMSAPNINGHITDSGEITFGDSNGSRSPEAVHKEAMDLKQIMDAGSLPATLQSQPISVMQITPDMGADNIQAGVKSAVYALIAVLIFMLMYYTITGAFADLALMFNLLLVLAAMALFGGTFTLPGIAGLVLTLGMAVDANVLINERIREELHKGASLWMAVRQGYDKVFWTIFDANLTCSLTSIVLIYVGSEEVKGFGYTLLIGLAIHMFTALFVTRTLMMTAIRLGVMRAIDDHSVGEYFREIFTFTWIRNGHWPFMKVITVSNIDWIGKRYIFWGISAVITIAGIVAFFARGEDKYDIEFRGGTQVTFQIHALPDGTFLDQGQVRHRIESLASLPGLADIESARVYGVGKPEEHRWEMQTTIANPKDQPDYVNKTLLVPLANAFHDVLNTTDKVTADQRPGEPTSVLANPDMQVLREQGYVLPITAGTLEQVFAKTPIQGIPNRSVVDFQKGTAIYLENIDKPLTAAELYDRINATRQSAEFNNVPHRMFKIIPVTAVTSSTTAPAGGAASRPLTTAPATEDDTRPLTRAVMVSVDPAKPYDENNESNWLDNATSEVKIVYSALSKQELFPGVTSFDAVVAGQAKMQALAAIILSLILIVIYVWIRFGNIRYGFGAILSLMHDAIVALAGTVLSGVAYNHLFGGHPFLLITDFKINLTMIAAYLTIIGYSVNDTIVIFDRVRELRGKSNQPLTAKLVNDAINQCFGRTIWTTFTVFIVVLIMYIFGGEGVRGFSFAMLIGVITGAYSTLAIASPMLLSTAKKSDTAPGRGITRANPFRTPEIVEP